MKALLLNEPKRHIMQIADYIKDSNTIFLEKSCKAEVLNTLIARAVELNYITDGKAFSNAINEREAHISTGIGDGIAIPHAKLGGVKDFFIMTAVLKSPVGWAAVDQKPVGLVFLIGGPDNAQTLYLQLLTRLMDVVKNSAKKAQILAARTPAEVASVFSPAG